MDWDPKRVEPFAWFLIVVSAVLIAFAVISADYWRALAPTLVLIGQIAIVYRARRGPIKLRRRSDE